MKRNIALLLSLCLTIGLFAGCDDRPASSSTEDETVSVPEISVPESSASEESSHEESSEAESSSSSSSSSTYVPASSTTSYSKPTYSSTISVPTTSSSSSSTTASTTVTPVLITEEGTYTNRSVVNLTITDDIGKNGEIILKGMTVSGTLLVEGGGYLRLIDCDINQLEIDCYGTTYEISAEGSTVVDQTNVMSDISLDEILDYGASGFVDLTTYENPFKYYIDIELDDDVRLNTVTLNTRTQITDNGEDTVKTIVNEKGYLIEYEPVSSGSGGSGSSSSYSNVTVDDKTVTLKNKTYNNVTIDATDNAVTLTLDNVDIRGTLIIKGEYDVTIIGDDDTEIDDVQYRVLASNKTLELEDLDIDGTFTVYNDGGKTVTIECDNVTTSKLVLDARDDLIVNLSGLEVEGTATLTDTTSDGNDLTLTIEDDCTFGSLLIDESLDGGAVTIDGEDDLTVTGTTTIEADATISNATLKNIVIAEGVTVTLEDVTSSGTTTVNKNANLILDDGSYTTLTLSGNNSNVTLKNDVEVTTIKATGNNIDLSIEDSTVTTLTSSGEDMNLDLKGSTTVTTLTSSGEDIDLDLTDGAKVTTLNLNNTGSVTVDGTGTTVGTLNVAEDITTPPTITVTDGGEIDTLAVKSESKIIVGADTGDKATIGKLDLTNEEAEKSTVEIGTEGSIDDGYTAPNADNGDNKDGDDGDDGLDSIPDTNTPAAPSTPDATSPSTPGTTIDSATKLTKAIADADSTVIIGGNIVLEEPLTISKNITLKSDGNETYSITGSIVIAQGVEVTFDHIAVITPLARSITSDDLTVNGTLHLIDSTISPDLTVEESGTLNAEGATLSGNLTVAEGGSVTADSGTTLSGDLTVAGTLNANGATLSGDTVTVSGTLKLNNSATASGSVIANAGATITVDSTATLAQITSPIYKIDENKIDTSATNNITVTASGFVGGWVTTEETTVFMWATAQTFTEQSKMENTTVIMEAAVVPTGATVEKINTMITNGDTNVNISTLYFEGDTYAVAQGTPIQLIGITDLTLTGLYGQVEFKDGEVVNNQKSSTNGFTIKGSTGIALNNIKVSYMSKYGISILENTVEGIVVPSTVTLTNVDLYGNSAEGLKVNSSIVTAQGLTTSDNGATVTHGTLLEGTVENPTTFTLLSGDGVATINSVNELYSFYSTSHNIGGNNVTVNATFPAAYISGWMKNETGTGEDLTTNSSIYDTYIWANAEKLTDKTNFVQDPTSVK